MSITTTNRTTNNTLECIERLVSGEDTISEIKDIQCLLLDSGNYYDTFGLRLSIGVLKNSTIVLSSKHWLKNYYIKVQPQDKNNINDKFVIGLWDVLIHISRTINREIEHDKDETHFVFIPNLNRDQTTKIYEAITTEITKRKFTSDIMTSIDVLGWNVNKDNAVKIPWVSGFVWD